MKINEGKSIAFMGLGLMGKEMARRLQLAGFNLRAYSRSRKGSDELEKLGVEIATSPREAAENCQIVISMVSDDAASKAVWTGPDGAITAMQPGSIAVECSTLSISWITELEKLATKASCSLVDAPVTGTTTHAKAGKLRFLVGGSRKIVKILKPVLTTLGDQTIIMGPTGSGMTMKLINNFMVAVQVASLAEAIKLVECSDLVPSIAKRVLETGSPSSPIVKIMIPRMTKRNFFPHFFLALMVKDLDYACQLGELLGLTLPSANCARIRFNEAVKAGLSELDVSSVIESIKPAHEKV